MEWRLGGEKIDLDEEGSATEARRAPSSQPSRVRDHPERHHHWDISDAGRNGVEEVNYTIRHERLRGQDCRPLG